METYHRVKQRECLSSIAKQYQVLDYHQIYDHPKNANLKRKRPNPNCLFPGDTLYIPNKQEKQADRGTSKMHAFQISLPTVLLRVSLLDEEDKPYTGKRYALKINGTVYRGSTNDKGLVEQNIPVDAEEGELMLWLDEEDE